jgi:hypothetical protein
MLHLEGFNDGLDFFHDMRVVDETGAIASLEKRPVVSLGEPVRGLR